jgi:hypothetical protein
MNKPTKTPVNTTDRILAGENAVYGYGFERKFTGQRYVKIYPVDFSQLAQTSILFSKILIRIHQINFHGLLNLLTVC